MIEIVDNDFTRGGYAIYENTYTATSSISTIAIGISGFDSTSDKLEVYYNGYLINLSNYSISGDNLNIVLTDWNAVNGDVFDFRVFKNAR
jgi:hypothetical protein